MSANPVNLAVRFFLEVASLIVMGLWGLQLTEEWYRYVAAVGIPLTAAAVWGIFRVPNDPGRAAVAVPGIVRLLIELGFFGFAVWALFALGAATTAVLFGAVIIVHYVLSFDRVLRLIRNTP
jgi:hypothetical protein